MVIPMVTTDEVSINDSRRIYIGRLHQRGLYEIIPRIRRKSPFFPMFMLKRAANAAIENRRIV